MQSLFHTADSTIYIWQNKPYSGGLDKWCRAIEKVEAPTLGLSRRTDRFPLRAKRTYEWEGKSYAGTHPPLVSPEIFSRVREVLSGKARPRKQKHDFAFSGLLHCAYDNCAVTAEFKKQKYTYYRCTGYRGKCDLPYFREEAMAERLGQVLQDDL